MIGFADCKGRVLGSLEWRSGCGSSVMGFAAEVGGVGWRVCVSLRAKLPLVRCTKRIFLSPSINKIAKNMSDGTRHQPKVMCAPFVGRFNFRYRFCGRGTQQAEQPLG